MRGVVIAFALGVAATAAIAVTALVAVAVAADAYGWGSFSIEGGPLLLLQVERTPAASRTTFGVGLPALAALGGFVNAAGAALVVRRN